MKDWNDDPTIVAWTRHVISDMVPKMEDSAVYIALAPGGEGDVKFWVELGCAIMLDKPVIIAVVGDRPISEHLRRVADEIVYMPEGVSPDAGERIAAAVERLAR